MYTNDFIFNHSKEKSIEIARQNQEAREYAEERTKREAIYKKITKDVKFVSKFVKKCQSRQTGEKTVFYDIDIEKMPRKELYGECINSYNKYHRLRGRSLNLSMYASIRQSMILDHSFEKYVIPAVKLAYDDYVKENYFGKEIEFEDHPGYFIKCKAFQIDWFDEVYRADKKIDTSFQKRIKEIEDKCRISSASLYPEEYEPESWEYAWINYVERYDISHYIWNCENMIKHPEDYSYIKNIDEYINETEKILHRRIR